MVGNLEASVKDLHTNLDKIAGEVGRLDTMSSRIQSLNLSMTDSCKEFAKTLAYLLKNCMPLMVDTKGVADEILGSWEEIKASLLTVSLQTNECRKEFGDFVAATKKSSADMFQNDSVGGERFSAWPTQAGNFNANLKQVLNDCMESSSLEAVLGRCLQSDARHHAMNTGIVGLCSHHGLALNPKPPPSATPTKQPSDAAAKAGTNTSTTANQSATVAPAPKPKDAAKTSGNTGTGAAQTAPAKTNINLDATVALPPPDIVQSFAAIAAYMAKAGVASHSQGSLSCLSE